MPAPLRLRLDQQVREAVATRYEQTHSAVERTNCQMVLFVDEVRTLTEIARLVRRGREQVRTILQRFRNEGLTGLASRQRTGRSVEMTSAWQALLGFGHKQDNCVPSWFTQIPIYNYGLGVARFTVADW
jgi:transposase